MYKSPIRFSIKLNKSKFILLVFIIFSIASIIIHKKNSNIIKTHELDWTELKRQPLKNQIGLVGKIESAHRQSITSPFDGVISELFVTEGSLIENGQAILKIDTTALDIQLHQAHSEFLKARKESRKLVEWKNSEEMSRARRSISSSEISLKDTEAKLSDAKTLYERGLIPRIEVDALSQQADLRRLDLAAGRKFLSAIENQGLGDNFTISQMELSAAEKRFNDLKYRRDRSTLQASSGGIIFSSKNTGTTSINQTVQIGRAVTQGTSIFEIVSLDQLQAISKIEESDLNLIQEGMPVELRGIGFDGTVLQGRVKSIGLQASDTSSIEASSFYDVIVDILPLTLQQRGRIRIGMSAQLSILNYSNDGVVLPAEVIITDNAGKHFINYREDLGQPATKREVKLGRTFPQGVEIIDSPSGYVGTTR